jgi:predicted acyl esterase
LDPLDQGGETAVTRTETTDGMRIEWDVPIETDDGTVLRADVFRPMHNDTEPCPVLPSYGPYAKGLAFQEGYPSAWETMASRYPDTVAGSSNKYQNWEVADPEKWVPDGYACGLSGISYYAMNQWHVASLNPPHLAAICPWEGAADWYRDATHHGGILSTFWANWYDMQVKTVQYGLGAKGPVNPSTGVPACGDETLTDDDLAANRADFGAEIRDHPFDDRYHRDRSPDWSRVTVPLLSSGNWGGQGLHLRGNVEGYVRSAAPRKWLEMHGGEHWTSYYTDYGVALQKRFFDHFLKGEDNGWDRTPPVRLQIRHADGTFSERTESAWPLNRARSPSWTSRSCPPAWPCPSRTS